MSDDISYCKYHFGFLKNVIFLENLSAIQQLAIGPQERDFIISNFTFSWWVAWLGEKEDSKIIRTIKNFRCKYAKINNDSGYFPELSIKFNYKEKKMGLKNLYLEMKGKCYQIMNFYSIFNK